MDRHFSARHSRVLRDRSVRDRLEPGPPRVCAVSHRRTISRLSRRAAVDARTLQTPLPAHALMASRGQSL